MTTLLNTAQARDLSAASTPLRRTTIVIAICIVFLTLSLAASLISLRTASPCQSPAPPRLSDIMEQLERRPSIFLVPVESAESPGQPHASESGAAPAARDTAMIDAIAADGGPTIQIAMGADEPLDGLPLIGAYVVNNEQRHEAEHEVASATIAKQEIEAAIATATQTLVERLRELEERLDEARTRDRENIGPKQTTIETHEEKAADSEPVPSRLVPESPVPIAAPTIASSLASSSQTPVSKPNDPDSIARTLGVEVAEGYRCIDRHCQGRHLRVTSVSPNSPIARLRCRGCGRTVSLSAGDLILSVNGTSVTSTEGLRVAFNQSGQLVLHVMQHQSGSHKDLVLEN